MAYIIKNLNFFKRMIFLVQIYMCKDMSFVISICYICNTEKKGILKLAFTFQYYENYYYFLIHGLQVLNIKLDVKTFYTFIIFFGM